MAEVNLNFEITLKNNFDKKGITIEDLKHHECETVFVKLSKNLDNWEVIGFYLGLTPPEIKAIKVNSNNEEVRRIQALHKWREKKGQNATYYNLIEALSECNRVDLIDQALNFLQKVLAVEQRTDEGIDSDTLKEEDIQFLCGCGACTRDEFLKNGCANPGAQNQFPLLDVTKLRSHTLVARLIRESKKVGEKFAGLLREILACLKDHDNIDVDELVMYISSLMKFSFINDSDYIEVQRPLKAAKTKSEVMKLLQSQVSWFNHSLIGSLVHEFKVSVRSYEEYVEDHLKPFLKKSLFEIPRKCSDEFLGSGDFVLKMSIPPPMDIFSADVVIALKDQVASALCISIDALEFRSYNSGCFELTFSAPYVLLKEMIPNNNRLTLVLQHVASIAPGTMIQAIKFDGKSQPIDSSVTAPVMYPPTHPKMTKVDRMFASLMVKLVRSITSKGISLDDLKKFICDLIPQQSFKKSIDVLPMFNAKTINEISSVRKLLMFLKDYWSFCSFSLLRKLINRFGDDDVKDTLKMYVTILQELTVQDIPLLLHHRSSIEGFSSDILTVTTTVNILSFSVENLLSIRDSIAQILQIENFALIFLQIKIAAKQLQFLISSNVTVKISPFTFSSANEARITSIQYQEIKQSQDKNFSESDDDDNNEGIDQTTLIVDDSIDEDSGLEASPRLSYDP